MFGPSEPRMDHEAFVAGQLQLVVLIPTFLAPKISCEHGEFSRKVNSATPLVEFYLENLFNHSRNSHRESATEIAST